MKLRPSDIAKLERFLKKIQKEVYPEPPSVLHQEITERMFKYVIQEDLIPPKAVIL